MNIKFLDDTRVPNHPYPELREVLYVFVNEITEELAGNLIGVYLVGSIATGDFDLDSDVDFLVVTNTELTETNIKSLQEIQMKIHNIDCYPAKHLEGSYISIGNLNNWQTVGEKELYYFDNGSTTFEQSTHDNKWHVRWILRERGITLIGQKPEQIMPSIPVSELSNEIKTAMLQHMKAFENEIDRPRSFWNSRFGQSFAVLTYCRMLHTLHTGTVQSKKAAANWAKQFVEPKWINIIDQAWNEREGVRFLVKIRQRAEQTLLYETLAFMKYAVARIGNLEVRAS
ncbi:MAG TPA: aminoglycoside adenylyltransferase domain-containing protein [Anaerolineales bacterium]|nr:aminoglycoside adenylyltransferase domain-containing protein [Anaerolineales bacterium]